MSKAPQIGDLLDGRYRLGAEIGRGAHGVVFAAEDETLSAKCAIKCLNPEIAAQPGFRARMLREAKAMGRLSGTSAVQILACNTTPDSVMYIAMEHLAGRDFESYLQDIEGHGNRIAVARLIELIGPIVDTLETAHGNGLIHRDLKPGNIMVLDTIGRGPVRLLDFGLAKDLRADALTARGMVAGSPSYIAPESWQGIPEILDHRIDVYSLGIVIFRALAGKPPFDGKQPLDRLLPEVLRAARPSLLALRPDLPEGIDAWVERALAIKREQRFSTVRELWTRFLSLTT